MLAKVQSCAVIGLEGALIEVEVDLSNGLAAFTIVGLPDVSVNESRERVRSAIKNSGCLFPYKRITANLAPADLRKEGPAYDLPIAIGVLLASGQINPSDAAVDRRSATPVISRVRLFYRSRDPVSEVKRVQGRETRIRASGS